MLSTRLLLHASCLLAVLLCLSSAPSRAATVKQGVDLRARFTIPPEDASNVKRVFLEVSQTTLWADGQPVPGEPVVNGTSPGPVLRFKKGDFLVIRVTNKMSTWNTTMHWHGLTQSMTPISDGVPMVTQWPIPPNTWFEYGIKLRDKGTYYYHPHVDLQQTTAHGAFIVEDGKEPPYKYDLDKPLILADYYYQPQEELLQGLLGQPFKWPGSAKALLLNGKALSSAPCNQTLASTYQLDCKDAPRNAGKRPEIVHLGHGKTIRLRWIGAQSVMYTKVAIANHKQRIIEADGTYTKSLEVPDIEIGPGQRYSTLVHGKTKEAVEQDGSGGCYWIRLESQWRNPGTFGWGLLAYPSCDVDKVLAQPQPTPAPINSTERMLPNSTFGWISGSLAPLKEPSSHQDRMPSDSEVSRRVILNAQQINILGSMGNYSRWTQNDVWYVEGADQPIGRMATKVPYLIQLYKRLREAPSWNRAFTTSDNKHPKGFDPLAQVWVAKPGEVIDVVIINNGSMASGQTEIHTWHKHGDKHWTLASGPGNFSAEALAQARSNGQWSDPIPRDTSTVWPGPGETTADPKVVLPAHSSGGWTVLRTKIQHMDLGVWLLHCHLIFHAAMGMSTTWALDIPKLGASSSLYDDPDYLEFGRNVTSPYTNMRP
ncbi:L-ascorbate oxidase [Ceraceosorus guamensis]|uniref:laccase n=1 Tax=Ceraceosorus guamensis TaxID=1522189 RepID=A0A316VV24_9BASI|nr:L-ascorbate oxidase [Ceraceosorus guamensis]PWN41467.1 L-ascorbate oxidase [Ceraceosorus guamensis]